MDMTGDANNKLLISCVVSGKLDISYTLDIDEFTDIGKLIQLQLDVLSQFNPLPKTQISATRLKEQAREGSNNDSQLGVITNKPIPTDKALPNEVCRQCGKSGGMFILTGISKRDGRPYVGHKCDYCKFSYYI